MAMGVLLAWAAALSFFVGVALQSVIDIPTVPVALLFVIAALSFAALYMRAAARALFVGVVCLSVGLGIVRMAWGELELHPDVSRMGGSKVVIEGIVVAEPDVRERSVRVPLEVLAINNERISMDARILAVVPAHTEVAYGDRVEAEGVIHEPTVFETDTGRIFNYPQFLAKDGIGYELSFAKLKVLEPASAYNALGLAIALKQWFLAGLGRALSEPAAGLAGGITLGDKRGLGNELSETFRAVGLTHIIVLSGYNIMVVVDALMAWMGRFPAAIRLVVGGFVALFFAAITGFASASTRAAAMAVIALIGKATGRIYIAGRILVLIACAMVLYNPYVLLFDPGFQLSILATAGLIGLSPLIASRLGWVPESLGLREVVAATLGTQLSVLPLLLYQSGAVPLYSLFANVLALIVVPYAMLLSALAALGGIIAGPLAPVIGFPAYLLLEYIILVARAFSNLPFAVVAVPAFSGWIVFVLYVLLVMLYWYIQRSGGPVGAAAQTESA